MFIVESATDSSKHPTRRMRTSISILIFDAQDRGLLTSNLGYFRVEGRFKR